MPKVRDRFALTAGGRCPPDLPGIFTAKKKEGCSVRELVQFAGFADQHDGDAVANWESEIGCF